MVISRKKAGERIVKDLYGGSLYGQGRGYYVALELLAIAWGSRQTNDGVVLTSAADPISYKRRGHDFARRLLFDMDVIPQGDRDGLGEEATLNALAGIFRSLVVPVPFKRTVDNWGGYHLYPYIAQLIHYDSVNRKGNDPDSAGGPHIERYLYRGGGALAYDLLRRDPKSDRRQRVESGIGQLTSDSPGPLGRLVSLVGACDSDQPELATEDQTVATQGQAERETSWSDQLRSGVERIVSSQQPAAKRVEYLMHWVPYCIARHQLELAHRELDLKPEPIVVDIAGVPGLRRESRRSFDRHRRFIVDALRARAVRTADAVGGQESADVYRGLVEGSQTWNEGVGDFYAATMAVIGGVNHNSGLRHYTLKLPLLEAMIIASIDSTDAYEGIPFSKFCYDVLYRRFGLVIDVQSGSKAAITSWVDNGDLKSNEDGLATLLEALGLLTALSDATRLVGGNVR